MRSFTRSLSLALVAALAVPAAAQPRQEMLTLERAIEIALVTQPSVKQNRAQIESAEARIDSARVAQRPTINLQASIAESSRRESTGVDGDTSGGFFSAHLSTGFSASGSWRIYDFGQTRANIRAAEASRDATAAVVATTTMDIRTDVAITYLEAVARAKLIAVAEATVRSEELHLDQARKFVEAQAKDPIEVVQAQARAANARSTLAQAQSNAAVALANLRSAIGFVDPSVTFVVDGAWPTPPADDPVDLVTLVSAARKQRPEITQFDKEVIAADAQVTAAQAQRRPVLSAQANTQWGPQQDDWSPQPSWTAALTLSWSLYDG
ncbi:MAG: TolC family protein, partial [Deltaproteobacteria bacterium]|nr:TolC family protein [Deltaproteobacteria bacterium]